MSRPVLWISWTLAATAVVAQSPPTYIPDIKFATGRSVVPYLEGWIRNPDDIKPGSRMPAMNLNEQELDAVTAYLASLR